MSMTVRNQLKFPVVIFAADDASMFTPRSGVYERGLFVYGVAKGFVVYQDVQSGSCGE